MSELASEKLSKRWESKRLSENRLSSGWNNEKSNYHDKYHSRYRGGSNKSNMKERLVTVREDIVGRIIGVRGSNIRAMEEQISKREGGECKIHSVKGFGGGTFIVKGSNESILEVAEKWLKKYQEEVELKEKYEMEDRKLEEDRKRQLQPPRIDSSNFPSFQGSAQDVKDVKEPCLKWGECDSLRNAIHGLKTRKKKEEVTENWYPDTMVKLPIIKPIDFYEEEDQSHLPVEERRVSMKEFREWFPCKDR